MASCRGEPLGLVARGAGACPGIGLSCADAGSRGAGCGLRTTTGAGGGGGSKWAVRARSEPWWSRGAARAREERERDPRDVAAGSRHGRLASDLVPVQFVDVEPDRRARMASAVLGACTRVRSIARQTTGLPMGAAFLSQDDSRQSTCQVSPATRTVARNSTVTRSSCARRNGSFSGFSTNAESIRPPRGVKSV